MVKMFNISTASHYPILRSRILLYIIAVIAFFNIFVLAGYGDYIYVLVFIILAFLISFCTKNMTVILCISMALTNILRFGAKATMIQEGLDTMTSSDVEENEAVPEKVAKAPAADAKKAKALGGGAPGGAAAGNMMEKLSSMMSKGAGKEDMANLQKRTEDLMGMQEKLMQNMNTLEPLLNKAEGFLTKYEGLKEKVETMKTMKEGLQNMKKEVGSLTSKEGKTSKEGITSKEGFTNYNNGIRW